MKLLTAFLLFIPFLTNGQEEINTTTGKGSENIYNDALSRFISIIHKHDKKYIDTLYIEKNFFFNPDDVLETVHGVHTKVVGWTETNELAELERSFLLIKFHPLAFGNGKFYIIISVSRTSSKKNYDFENGVAFYYLYSNKKKAFQFLTSHYLKTQKGTINY